MCLAASIGARSVDSEVSSALHLILSPVRPPCESKLLCGSESGTYLFEFVKCPARLGDARLKL